MVSFMAGQKIDRIAKDDSKTGILAREIQRLSNKVTFLESQLGQASVVSEIVLTDIQYEIDNAADWYYKRQRVECVQYVESIKAMVETNELAQAIKVIDFLILNQAKYFYKSYNRRPITVARFESIKTKLGE